MNRTIEIFYFVVVSILFFNGCFFSKGKQYEYFNRTADCLILDSLCPPLFFNDWNLGDSIDRTSRSKYMYYILVEDTIGLCNCLDQFIGVDTSCIIDYFGKADVIYHKSGTLEIGYFLNYTQYEENQFEFRFIIKNGVINRYTISIP